MPFPTPQRHNPGTDAPGGMPRHPDTSSSARGEAAEDDHAHVQPLLHPDLVHDADHLQRQHVLPQVVAALRAPGGQRPEQGGERQGQAAHGFWGARCPRFGHPTEDELTLKMTRIFSPRGSTFWKESFRGTALELK